MAEETNEEGVKDAAVEETPKNKGGKKAAQKEEKSEEVLVLMERANYSYEVMGITFTQDTKIRAVDAGVADAIFASQDGFRPATPQEARDFYAN